MNLGSFLIILGVFVPLAYLTCFLHRQITENEDPYIKVVLGFMGGVILAVIIVPVTWFFLALGPGLYPDYSEGIREGYIIKASERGVIWKTWEGQLQLGAGAQAALQEPFDFCINRSNPEVNDAALELMGKHVIVRYRQWLVTPFKIGSSKYEVTEINQVFP